MQSTRSALRRLSTNRGKSNPAWSSHPVDVTTFSSSAAYTTYPFDHDAGTEPRLLTVEGAAFLGASLFVTGSTLGPRAISLLFTETGKPMANGLATVRLVEPRVSSFERVAAAPTGGAYLAGPSNTGRIGVVKITGANALDPAFGSSGLVEVADPASGVRVHGLGVDRLGHVLVVYTSDASAVDGGSSSYASIVRLTSGGAVDATYGAAGFVQVPLIQPTLRNGFGVVVEPSGGVLVGGIVPNGGASPLRAGIMRLAPDGAIDSAFGGAGSGGVAVAPLPPGKGPNDSLSPQGVILAGAPAGPGSCDPPFFAIFAQQPGRRGYVFE